MVLFSHFYFWYIITVVDNIPKKSHLSIMRATFIFLVNSAVCLHLWFQCQLFVYILVPLSAVCLHFSTFVSYLFTLWYHCQLFVYLYATNVSCLFTFMLPTSAVCLLSCYHCQLFVYIMIPVSAVCLHLPLSAICLHLCYHCCKMRPFF